MCFPLAPPSLDLTRKLQASVVNILLLLFQPYHSSSVLCKTIYQALRKKNRSWSGPWGRNLFRRLHALIEILSGTTQVPHIDQIPKSRNTKKSRSKNIPIFYYKIRKYSEKTYTDIVYPLIQKTDIYVYMIVNVRSLEHYAWHDIYRSFL